MRQFFCSDSGASKCSAGLVVGWLGVLLIALGAVFAWVELAHADDCVAPCNSCPDMHGQCKVVQCALDASRCPTYAAYVNIKYCCNANGTQCVEQGGYFCDTQCRWCQQ